jgi:hypothetical protein
MSWPRHRAFIDPDKISTGLISAATVERGTNLVGSKFTLLIVFLASSRRKMLFLSPSFIAGG